MRNEAASNESKAASVSGSLDYDLCAATKLHVCVCVCVQVRQYCIRLHNEYNHVVWMRYWIASNDNDVDAAIGVSAALPSITSENMAHSFEVGFEIYTQANRLAVVLH
jgi:hypothetical protein